MSSITPDLGTIRTKAPPIGVFMRHYWDDDWQRVLGVEVDYFEFGVQPTLPEAMLRWRYGRGMWAGEIHKTVKPRLACQDWYVKIVVNPDALAAFEVNNMPPWYGRVVDVFDERRGYQVRDGVTIPQGVQTIVCHGLEVDLEAVRVDRSVISDPLSGQFQIARAIPFNAGTGDHTEIAAKGFYGVKPNRSVDDNTSGSYVFTSDAALASAWSSQDIIEYLLVHFAPMDNGGAARLPYALTNEGHHHLTVEFPKIDPQGKTVLHVLNSVLDRRRAIGWYLRPTDTTIELVSFTLNDVTIPLPDGKMIPPNGVQRSIDFDSAVDILKNEIRVVESSRYDRVIIRGARIGVVMTLSTFGGGIVKGWTDAEKTLYDQGASLAADYANDGGSESGRVMRQQTRNDRARAEARCKKVYSFFVLNPLWNGRAEDGEGDNFQDAFCEYDADASPPEIDWESPVTLWSPGLRFQRELPPLAGVDYSNVRIDAGLCMIPDGVFEKGDPTHKPLDPIVAVRLPDDPSGPRYELIDKLSDVSRCVTESDVAPRWSASITVRDDAPGIVLKVHGMKQHVLARGLFDGDPEAFVPLAADSLATEGYTIPTECWQNNLVFTVYALQDKHHEVIYPEPSFWDQLTTDRLRVLVIDTPEYHLDYVVPMTVVDVQDRQLVRSISGGIIRDHTKHMKALALLAGEWYCKQRKVLTLQYRQIRRLVDLGDIITQIGSPGQTESIRTCVTRIRYDCAGGTTTIQTQYAELDARVF